MPRLQNSFITAFNNDESAPSFGDRWLSNLYLSILDQSTLEANQKDQANEVPSAADLAKKFSEEKWGWKWSYKWLTVPATAIIEVLTNSLAEITLSANINLDVWKRKSLSKLNPSWERTLKNFGFNALKTIAIAAHGITSSISFIGHFLNRMTNNFSKNPATSTFTTILGASASIIVGATVGLTALLSNPIGWGIILIGGPILFTTLVTKIYSDYQEIKNDKKLMHSEKEKKEEEKEDKAEAIKIENEIRNSTFIILDQQTDKLVNLTNIFKEEALELTLLKSTIIDLTKKSIVSEIPEKELQQLIKDSYSYAFSKAGLTETDTHLNETDEIKILLDTSNTIMPEIIEIQGRLAAAYDAILHAMKTKLAGVNNLQPLLNNPAALVAHIKKQYQDAYHNLFLGEGELALNNKISQTVANAIWEKYSEHIIKKYKEAAMLVAMIDDYNKNPATFNINTYKAEFLNPVGAGSIPEAENNLALQQRVWNRIVAEFDKAIDAKLKKSQSILNTYKRQTIPAASLSTPSALIAIVTVKNNDYDSDGESIASMASSHSSETLTTAVDTTVTAVAEAEKAAKETAAKVATIIRQALPAKSTEEIEETQNTNHSVLASWKGSTATPLRDTQQFLRPTVSVR